MFNICWGSCENRWVHARAAYHIVNDLNAVAFWRLDDMPYCNQSSTSWGTTTVGVDKDSTVADFQAIYTQSDANPGMVHIDTNVPNRFRVAGDHGVGGNDWDHTYETSDLSAGASAIGSTNDLAGQNERNTHWANGMTAFLANSNDNPAYVLPAAIPTGAAYYGATPAASNYVPRYFKVGFDVNGARNDSNPFVECFTLDAITSRDPIKAADRTALGISAGDVVMLSTEQEAQLLADLAASTATFKLIMSAKKLFANVSGDNGDIWAAAGGSAGYEVQRNRILDAIEAASGWAVPGGVAWISGDRHLSCVDVKNTPGDSWDVVNLTSAVWNKEAVAGSQDDSTTVFMDTTNFSFGAISVFSDKLELSIRNSLDGKKMVSGFVYAGTNKWVAETLSVAI